MTTVGVPTLSLENESESCCGYGVEKLQCEPGEEVVKSAVTISVLYLPSLKCQNSSVCIKFLGF